MAATHFLPRLVPQQTATRLLLTGEVVSGAEAERLGLMAESVPQVFMWMGIGMHGVSMLLSKANHQSVDGPLFLPLLTARLC
jgi:enoyl-CoA hydratase/carnithine racemase